MDNVTWTQSGNSWVYYAAVDVAIRKDRGRRFSHSMKLLGISLFKRSPAQYKVFRKIFSMPERQTLNKVNVFFWPNIDSKG